MAHILQTVSNIEGLYVARASEKCVEGQGFVIHQGMQKKQNDCFFMGSCLFVKLYTVYLIRTICRNVISSHAYCSSVAALISHLSF